MNDRDNKKAILKLIKARVKASTRVRVFKLIPIFLSFLFFHLIIRQLPLVFITLPCVFLRHQSFAIQIWFPSALTALALCYANMRFK